MKASVVVLNWNGKHLLEECLDSLLGQEFTDFEIILVDNGSTDGSLELLKLKYAHRISLLSLKSNIGFAGGCNAGIKHASGEYILLLNNDTKADSKWIQELIKPAEGDKTIGMCASKILNYYSPDEFDTLGHLMYPDGLNRGRGKFEKDRGQYDTMEEVLFPSGAAALYRKCMLDETGLFDEDFFAYGDDTDIGLKARLAGWKCMYVPSAVVYHKSSASTEVYSPWKVYLIERNRVLILFKYFPLSYILMSPFYTITRFWYNSMSAVVKRGATHKFLQRHSLMQLAIVLIKAYIMSLILFPATVRKRFRMAKMRKINNAEFSELLKRYSISARELTLKD